MFSNDARVLQNAGDVDATIVKLKNAASLSPRRPRQINSWHVCLPWFLCEPAALLRVRRHHQQGQQFRSHGRQSGRHRFGRWPHGHGHRNRTVPHLCHFRRQFHKVLGLQRQRSTWPGAHQQHRRWCIRDGQQPGGSQPRYRADCQEDIGWRRNHMCCAAGRHGALLGEEQRWPAWPGQHNQHGKYIRNPR